MPVGCDRIAESVGGHLGAHEGDGDVAGPARQSRVDALGEFEQGCGLAEFEQLVAVCSEDFVGPRCSPPSVNCTVASAM